MGNPQVLKGLAAFAACATALGLMPGMYGQQASGASGAAKTSLQKQKMLEAIRTEDPAEIAAHRKLLAQGTEAQRVREFQTIYPSPAETWLAVLRRDMEDGRPLELYKQIVEEGRGTEKPEELLNALGTAALNDRKEVRIGGEVVDATPALSLDAGYTKGFREKVTMASIGIVDTDENVRKLHVLAEGCLDGQNMKPPPLSACFTAGLAFAAKDATRQR